jgi:hypothetical protein
VEESGVKEEQYAQDTKNADVDLYTGGVLSNHYAYTDRELDR